MPKNYLEYNRPVPESTDNGVRVTTGIGFGHRNTRKPTKAQPRTKPLKVLVVKPSGHQFARRVPKGKLCVFHGLWLNDPTAN